MGKYAYVKIEYHVVSQANGFVNRFYENYQKYFSKAVCKVNGQPIFSVAHILFYALNDFPMAVRGCGGS